MNNIINILITHGVKWGIAFVIFIVALVVWGCAPKTVVEYKYVDVPVKCSITTPTKPTPVTNPVEMNLLLLQYTNELEAAIRSCN